MFIRCPFTVNEVGKGKLSQIVEAGNRVKAEQWVHLREWERIELNSTYQLPRKSNFHCQDEIEANSTSQFSLLGRLRCVRITQIILSKSSESHTRIYIDLEADIVALNQEGRGESVARILCK